MNRFTLSVALAAAVTASACRESTMQPDLLAAAADVSAGTASSSSILTQSFDMPLSAFTRVTFASCRAPSGPGITLNSRLDLSGLRTQVAVEGDTAGTPDEALATFEVVSTSADVDLPPRSDRAGVGDDPLVWIQFEDNQGTELSPEIPLGRCTQLTTARDLAIDYEELGRAVAEISVKQCGSQLGPVVSVAGHLALENGLRAQVIVRDDQPAGSAEEGADAILRIQLYEPGYEIDFRRQQLRTDVAGDPSISAAYLDGQGNFLTEPVSLGTCENLTPAVGG